MNQPLVAALFLAVALVAASCDRDTPSTASVGPDYQSVVLSATDPVVSETEAQTDPRSQQPQAEQAEVVPSPTSTPSAEAMLGTRVGGGAPTTPPMKSILIPPGDLITLEEHILTSDVIARVRLNSIVASSRLFDAGSWFRHVPAIHFTFDVLEVLQGSAGSSVVVEMTADDYATYTTAEKAVSASIDWIAGRDSTRDDREALVFLWSLTKSGNTDVLQGRPDTVQYVFAANGNADWGDNYSIKPGCGLRLG